MTWRARLFSSGLIVACVLAPALPLQAQSRSERNEAREHFKRGRAYHDLGQYQDAAREYLAAYELSNKPKLLFNVAQAYWSAGDKRKALAYYEKYVDMEPNGPVARTAREQIRLLREDIAIEEAEAERRAKEAREAEAARKAAEARKAREAREAEAARKAAEEARRAAARRTAARKAQEEARQNEIARQERRVSILRIGGIATMATGLVATGLGVKFGLDARNIANELSNVEWEPSLDERIEDGDAAERNMFVFYGVGAAAIAAGGMLFYLSTRPGKRAEESQLSIVPAFDTTSGSISVQARF